MHEFGWQQAIIGFADHRDAERTAVTHVIPILMRAEDTRLVSAWFIVRKGTHWRLRYLPTRTGSAHTHITDCLTALHRAGHLADVVETVYEPEVHAFGGHRAMRIAHRLWHLDSRHLFTPTPSPPRPTRTREMSLLLCAEMLRAAGLDWYEQGDVWARAADHRDPADSIGHLLDPVRRLLTVAPASLTQAGAPLAVATTWLEAFTTSGKALRRLNDDGHLHRGLRDVLTHHVIFAWNRRGIPDHEQAALASTARTVVFGNDPTITTETEQAAA
ncbi:thiopeptide-type bacteriocin biosynthesis protein [Actinoplanes sp. L3-i22]|uniref:thiopeptide-type bacteriocin biosynthesis protein n=1 Tax=Actinoplanes sp. L3-i22 TaxID=2836373 RepID=UPI001C78A09B|nr:thiopeptide-type bacteriocin biosynthesis protein [Actinoplanes sp. L3-i22]BCY07292.1 hypothetical protein L3i22_023800 [Actinoplanes sp. L3-i22]